MPPLISCQSLTKSFGAKALFSQISFGLSDGDRVGLIGPNGSGKSTLLKIIAGLETADDGNVVINRSVKLGYLAQKDDFRDDQTIESVLLDALCHDVRDDHDKHVYAGVVLSTFGFDNPLQRVGTLSGGWRKRLAIAAVMAQEPTLVLMDEPTNHLDLEGLVWLEDFLKHAPFSYLIVSHDRYFLENVTNQMAELNVIYPNGYYQTNGSYSDFLERRDIFLAGQQKQQETLANQVRREVEWLRSGVKARTTKSYSRIKKAGEMQRDLADLKGRNASQSHAASISFTASGRRSKQLLHAENLTKRFGDKTLFNNLTFTLSPGDRVGLVGLNGSGKTTLIKLLTGELEPDGGTIERAHQLQVVTFDQNRTPLNQQATLKELLAPEGGDQVIYRGMSIAIASWARRFLFRTEQLVMPAEKLSGGEQARVLIARLMLKPADLLILDEPTNDLDIPTLEILEESLLEFPGALVLVTHDRYLLDRVSNVVLGLDGRGAATIFADYHQWEREHLLAPKLKEKEEARKKEPTKPPPPPAKPSSGRLSYNEQREWDAIEETIMKAETHLADCQAKLDDPAIQSDATLLQQLCDDLHTAQTEVERLYARWEELGNKQK